MNRAVAVGVRDAEQPSDEQLVRCFIAGDEAAFEALVLRHQDRVYRIALGLVGDPQDAADAAQEVFLRAYTGLGGFRFGAAPLTWLTRVARNVCSELRRKQRPGAGDPDGLAAGDAPHGLHYAEQRRLRRWLDALPVRQREAVVLRILEEMSVTETARVMGCREGTVKALTFKAMRALEEMAK